MYTDNRYTWISASTDLTTSTGQRANTMFSVGYHPVIIRHIAVMLNAAPGDAGVLRFDKRVTFGTDTGIVTGVETINLATTHAAGQVVYLENANVSLLPGEQFVCNVTDVSANVTAAVFAYSVEQLQDSPANRTIMIATT